MTDNGSPAASDFETFTITVGNVNRPPVLGAIGAKTATEGVPLTFTATATDPDGGTLTFSSGNLPTGATLTPAGAFSWTPTATQGQTTPYSVTITVTDNGNPTASDSDHHHHGRGRQPAAGAGPDRRPHGERKRAPHVHGNRDRSGRWCADLRGREPAGRRDPERDDRRLQLDADFSQGQTTPYSVTVIVTDAGGLNDQETFTITVGNVNRPPVLAAIGAKTATGGVPLTFTATATDPDGGALTFAATNLPAGATLNATTGAFSWTPTSSGRELPSDGHCDRRG